MSDYKVGNLHSSVDHISITNTDGDVVWKGTAEMWGFFLAAMRGDIKKQWWCQSGDYWPPCTNETDRHEHMYAQRHRACCWIVYYEIKEER